MLFRSDKNGNPIEIGMVLVYRIEDTYKATFDVNGYNNFVKVQSEAGLRTVASLYAYDTCDVDENELLTLRGGKEEIGKVLLKEVQERV